MSSPDWKTDRAIVFKYHAFLRLEEEQVSKFY
jgi:hypothetical protein